MGWIAGYEFRDLVLQRQFALFFELQNSYCSKLLRNRTYSEDHIGLYVHIQLKVRFAKAFAVNNFPFFDNQGCTTRAISFELGRQYPVKFCSVFTLREDPGTQDQGHSHQHA